MKKKIKQLKIFLGSSTKSAKHLSAIELKIEECGHIPIKWNDKTKDIFIPGKSTLESLIIQSYEVDAAIFLYAPDDIIIRKGQKIAVARDNVVFEHGLFMGHLGSDKTLGVITGKVVQQTDLNGINYINISPKKLAGGLIKLENWLKRISKNQLNILRPIDILNDFKLEHLKSIEIIAHTGSVTVKNIVQLLISKNLHKVELRVLLRSPEQALKRRQGAIRDTIDLIESIKNKSTIKYYNRTPTIRSVKFNYRKDIASDIYTSFYTNYGSKSKAYSEFQDRMTTTNPDLIRNSLNFYKYFWGKKNDNYSQIHTILIDFDDTLVRSYDIQVNAYVDLIRELINNNEIVKSDLRDHIICNDEINKNHIRKIFFTEQSAYKILKKIFKISDEAKLKSFNKRRYDFRETRMINKKLKKLIPAKMIETICQLEKKYTLVIVSATDEVLIQAILKKIKVNKTRNLSSYFTYIFGKNESKLDVRGIKNKSGLFLKLNSTLSLPNSRLVYIGDSLEDSEACSEVNLRFIEAKINSRQVKKYTGKASLVQKKSNWWFNKWDQLPRILSKMK